MASDCIFSKSSIGILAQLRFRTERVNRGHCNSTIQTSLPLVARVDVDGRDLKPRNSSLEHPTLGAGAIQDHVLLRQHMTRLIADCEKRTANLQPPLHCTPPPPTLLDLSDPNELERIGAAPARRRAVLPFSPATCSPPAFPARAMTAPAHAERPRAPPADMTTRPATAGSIATDSRQI